ncbi:MAG: trypsin-like peptidase domain-containing protein, partial [Clostridia bacterium]|nr:trypsin-like peptidase domain-containing protein [Clostridia bacterium]
MYGDDRKNDDERENGAFGAYSSPERGDGYRRPEFGEKNISEGDSDNNEAKNSDGEAVNNTDLGDGRAVGNAHPTANNAYPGNGYASNGYTNNGYAGNGYPNNGYQNNPYMGNGGGNGYYGGYNGYYPRGNSPVNGGYSPAVAENKRRLWVIPVAILLCLAMCVGCFFVGLSMVGRGAPYGDDEQITDSDGAGNGGSGGNGGNSEGSSDTGNKSPYLGGGEVELEQLPADSIYYTIPSVVSATKDTVVEITTETVTTGSFWGQYVTQGAGSGVIIKSYPEKGESGACGTYIVTNNHVIDGAFSISVTLTNGAEYIAHLVATDPQTDIAVLHIDEANLPTAKLGSSSQLVAGQTVVVIGNPLGSLGGSVSSGIVSCTERNIEMDNRVMKLIQTT